MNKITISDKVMIRLPRFSYTEELKDCWDELKTMIRDSSPEFHAIIKDLSYEVLASTDRKIRQTVYKYFNRSCYRATPYGRFATVGMGTLGRPGEVAVVNKEPDVHRFADWSNLTLPVLTTAELQEGDIFLFSNTTFYTLQDEIRFIQKTANHYQVVAIDVDPIIIKILDYCQTPVTYGDLRTKLQDELPDDHLAAYTDYLLSLQLLITSLHQNIIGTDYFLRTQQSQPGKNGYIISERTTIGGNFNRELFQHLPGLIQTLQQVLPYKDSQALSDFKGRFIKRFEEAEVPLMLALDAEAGIGYGNLEQYEERKMLEPFLKASGDALPNKGTEKLRELLYKEITHVQESKQAIDLENLIQKNLEGPILPSSFSAGVTLVDETLFIDYLGGATATAIAGRFAFAIPELKEYCRGIARQEQAANPDILFFDIGYTKENRVDNINRRPAIYELELNVLNYDTSKTPLSVSDLLISVRNGEVILRSKKSGKRLVPRMATAYNYRRSDLSLFRLLMDIQNQKLRIEMLFRPASLIPGLDYYPRIQYRNIVVTPAAWKLTTNIFKGSDTREKKIAALAEHLKTAATTRHIKTGIADQTLLLDTENFEDIDLLLTLIEKERHIYVEETAIGARPSVASADGFPFLPQLVLTLQHQMPIYTPNLYAYRLDTAVNKKWVAPGSDWLYFEIYATPYQVDMLMHEKIRGYLEVNRHTIVKWFFIRYNDGGDHIRLRLQLKDISVAYSLITELSARLQPELESGIVHDLKLCTYKKEIARYSAEMMDDIEIHFYCDSEFILSVLPAMHSVNARYLLCADLFDGIMESGVIDNIQAKNFLDIMADAYNKEHGITIVHFKELNRRYKEFRKEALPSLSLESAALHERLKRSFIAVLANCPEISRAKLLGDLIHMHINRLFAKNQRVHEMVIYNFLQLAYKARQHRMVSNAIAK